METNHLLASTRPTYILIAQPTNGGRYWASQLPGLSWDHITQATGALRTEHASKSTKLRDDHSLKTSALHKAFARALGVSDQQEWRKLLDEDLPLFMRRHGLVTPADLIKPTNQRISMIQLDPREVADRIFNSKNPLPRRIYSGVGGKLFQYAPVHSLFIEFLRNNMLEDTGQHRSSQLIKVLQKRGAEKIFDENGLQHAHEFYRKLPNGKEAQITNEEFLQLTWRDVLLSGGELYFKAGTMLDTLATRHRLLCSGVMGPLQEEAAPHDGNSALFSILGQALAEDTDGWVDVVPFNNHLCFLKGKDGRFDWVVRDQRNESLSINPLYPILDAKELPSEHRNTFSVWHYYQTSRSFHDDHLAAWTWQHDHGDLLKGERKPMNMVEQYLRDAGTYRVVARPYAAPVESVKRPIFYDHRVSTVPLQVSELITAEQFMEFVRAENWLQKRAQRAERAGIRLESIEPQLQDKDLPAGVTYYDAIAYCGWLEKQLGASVRLLTPTEWQSALPAQLKERHLARLQNYLTLDQTVRMRSQREANRGERPRDRVVGCEFDGKLMDHEDLPWLDRARYDAVPVRFVEENVSWMTNDDGLPFLDGRGFGEWLNNISHGHAPAVCAAYGRTLSDGELHTADHAICSTYKHHGCKIGFRVCFIQSLDS